MTILGAIFAIAYLIGLGKYGMRGLLTVTVCAAPFSSSAMIAFGGNGVTPFYVGVILYIIVSLAETLRSPVERAPFQSRSGVLAVLVSVVGLTAIAGPTWFAGLPVIAPGVGLDQQVGTQTPLTYSMSGLAQFGYLALALLLVHLNQRHQLISRRMITMALAIGVTVALAAYAFSVLGITWPKAFFDNFPGNFYAKGSSRLRAQFAEPSQLGAFSLVAFAYFATATLTARAPKRVLAHLAFAGGSALLLVASYSGTAIVGLVITAAFGAVIGVVVWIRNGARIRPVMAISGCVMVIVAIPLSEYLVNFVTEAVDGKYGGTSFRNRGLANDIAFRIYNETNFIGVGIGNNRASSLFPMLLSTIGILGVLLFLVLICRSIFTSVALMDRRPLAMGLLAQMAAAFTSLADFSSPIMWTLIAACYVARPRPEEMVPQIAALNGQRPAGSSLIRRSTSA